MIGSLMLKMTSVESIMVRQLVQVTTKKAQNGSSFSQETPPHISVCCCWVWGSGANHTVTPLRGDHSACKRSSSVYHDNDHKRRRAGTRIKRSDGELQAFKISFKKFFQLKKPPNNTSVEKAILRFPCLKNRSLPQIKSRAFIQTGH
jgi:hypothetical protein